MGRAISCALMQFYMSASCDLFRLTLMITINFVCDLVYYSFG